MKKQNNSLWFTLVELIVVITILAILGTIAFISLQGYSAQARDSKRLSDIQNIKKSLELFSLNTWKYPLPDNKQTVSYSWEILWYQWIVWDIVTTNLSRNLNIKPTDPLTELEYTYSTIDSQTKYELLSIYESDLISYNNLLNGINAANANYPKINWNYNWVFVKATTYYIPTPSIITSEDLSLELDFEIEPLKIKSQIITGWENNLANGQIEAKIDWLPNFTVQAFSWVLNTTNWEDTNWAKEELANKLILAYSWTLLANNWIYKQIVETTWTNDLISLIDDVALSSKTYASIWSSDWWTTNYSCDETTKPADDLNKTYTINPTSENQAYVQDSAECWYTCTPWYTWTNCEIAPNPYVSCTWVNNPIPFSATTIYWQWTSNECSDSDIIVCSWNGIWYTISACNVWATEWSEYASCIDIASCTTAIVWNYYQFGKNDTIFVNWESWYSYDWKSPGWIDAWSANDWWVEESEKTTATYSNQGSVDQAKMQWPCASWYHVPTNAEWVWIHTAGWWWTNWTNMSNALKMPLAGYRIWSDGLINSPGGYGYYWSSSPKVTSGYRMCFTSTSIYSLYGYFRANMYSVRCFKN